MQEMFVIVYSIVLDHPHPGGRLHAEEKAKPRREKRARGGEETKAKNGSLSSFVPLSLVVT